MAKRKSPEPDDEPEEPTPSKRQRKLTEKAQLLLNGSHSEKTTSSPLRNGTPKKPETPSRRGRKSAADALLDEEEQDQESPTPKVNGRTLFTTPRRGKAKIESITPSRSVKAKADRSAKRKSARLLAEAQNQEEDDDDDNLDGQDARLAREILEDEDGSDEDEDGDIRQDRTDQDVERLVTGDEAPTPSKTPRKGGRPKGAKNKRSPTPEGDIPPEERYFYQNRAGPPQVSSNKFNSVKLLNHEEYFEQVSSWKDPHRSEKAFLMKLHARSFPQWQFELDEGFGLCLYGYGSKRPLVSKFAEWLYKKADPDAPPRIVIVNGYTPKLNIRSVLNTIASATADSEDETIRLTGQPEDMLDALFSRLTTTKNPPPPSSKLYILINSIDAASLRRSGIQSLLSRLSSHPQISFLCTADTPTFPTLWNSSLLDHFRFVFHDCTTFAPYEVEVESVVDDVHELLGRRRMRVGGQEGVGFVLKSLPENARNLYRLLLSEILTIVEDGGDVELGAIRFNHQQDDDDDDDDEDGNPRTPKKKEKKKKNAKSRSESAATAAAEDIGIEYRALYRKASEEFICSSSMNFQFLLKEFLDHQMITSRRDPVSGAEMLGVPLGKAEMEAVLEELI